MLRTKIFNHNLQPTTVSKALLLAPFLYKGTSQLNSKLYFTRIFSNYKIIQ